MHLIIGMLAAAAPESGSVMDVVSESWWVPMLGTIATALAAVITWAIRKLVNHLIAKMNATDAEKEALQCLLQGMAKAQDDFVREAKAAASDGKLKKDEIEKAKKIAIDHALSLAKGPAKDVLVTMGVGRMGSLIKQLLAKMSKDKAK
jgi:hypothetical protein